MPPRNLSALAVAVVVAWTASATGATLEQQLGQVDLMRAARVKPYDEIEAACRRLLADYPEPEQQGKIYFMLADVYAQAGHKRPDRSVAHAKKALEYPHPAEKRQLLYIYWGDALRQGNRKKQGQELAAARREAVVPFLHGLKDLLQYDLPEAPPEIPRLDSYDFAGPDGDPRGEALRRQYEARLKAHRRALFERDMIQNHSRHTSRIAYMYSRLPFATEELQQLATEIIADQDAVEQLMAAVSTQVEERLQKLGKQELYELPDRELALDRPGSPVTAPVVGSSGTASENDPQTLPPAGDAAVLSQTGGDDGTRHLWLVGAAAVLVAAVAICLAIARRRHARCRQRHP